MNLEVKTVNIGEIYIAEKPMRLMAVLGSCVAVCLFDEMSGIAGMNHYLLAESEKSSNLLDTKILFRYGNISIPALIKKISKLGAKPERLVGKIFGGGMSTALEYRIGLNLANSNIEIAEKILKEAGIMIVEKCVGGADGRKIVFDTKSGMVSVESIHIKIFQSK